jgi:hypothetical protein
MSKGWDLVLWRRMPQNKAHDLPARAKAKAGLALGMGDGSAPEVGPSSMTSDTCRVLSPQGPCTHHVHLDNGIRSLQKGTRERGQN